MTRTSFSFLSITFTNMLAMWFFGGVSKNIPIYRMLRAKYFIHVNGGKQK